MMETVTLRKLYFRSSLLLLLLVCDNLSYAQIRENSYFSMQVNTGPGILSKKYADPPCSIPLGTCFNKYVVYKTDYITNFSGLYNLKFKPNSPFILYSGMEFYFIRIRMGIAEEWRSEYDSLYPNPKTDSLIKWRKYISFPIGIQYELMDNFSILLNVTYHFGEWVTEKNFYNGTSIGDYKFVSKAPYYHYNLGFEYLIKEKHGVSLRLQAPFELSKSYKNYKWIFQIGYKFCFIK